MSENPLDEEQRNWLRIIQFLVFAMALLLLALVMYANDFSC